MKFNNVNCLRNTDGAEGQSAVADPLDTPTEDVDLSYPLLQGDRIIRMEIRKPSVVAAKKNKDGQVLVLPLVTTAELTDTKGNILHPGFKATTRVGLTPTPDYPAERIAKALTQWARAVGLDGKTTPRMIIQTPSLLDGKLVDVKTSIKAAEGSYPESNNFSPVIPG